MRTISEYRAIPERQQMQSGVHRSLDGVRYANTPVESR
nr:hypothetical protein JVH1_3017 [Rhodococcus sp. JVH1]